MVNETDGIPPQTPLYIYLLLIIFMAFNFYYMEKYSTASIKQYFGVRK